MSQHVAEASQPPAKRARVIVVKLPGQTSKKKLVDRAGSTSAPPPFLPVTPQRHPISMFMFGQLTPPSSNSRERVQHIGPSDTPRLSTERSSGPKTPPNRPTDFAFTPPATNNGDPPRIPSGRDSLLNSPLASVSTGLDDTHRLFAGSSPSFLGPNIAKGSNIRQTIRNLSREHDYSPTTHAHTTPCPSVFGAPAEALGEKTHCANTFGCDKLTGTPQSLFDGRTPMSSFPSYKDGCFDLGALREYAPSVAASPNPHQAPPKHGDVQSEQHDGASDRSSPHIQDIDAMDSSPQHAHEDEVSDQPPLDIQDNEVQVDSPQRIQEDLSDRLSQQTDDDDDDDVDDDDDTSDQRSLRIPGQWPESLEDADEFLTAGSSHESPLPEDVYRAADADVPNMDAGTTSAEEPEITISFATLGISRLTRSKRTPEITVAEAALSSGGIHSSETPNGSPLAEFASARLKSWIPDDVGHFGFKNIAPSISNSITGGEGGFIYVYCHVSGSGFVDPSTKQPTSRFETFPAVLPEFRRADGTRVNIQQALLEECETDSTKDWASLVKDQSVPHLRIKIGRATCVQSRLQQWVRDCNAELMPLMIYDHDADAGPLTNPVPLRHPRNPPSSRHRTAENSAARHASARRADIPWATIKKMRKVPHISVVEGLIHDHLTDANITMPCGGCPTRHKEWFHIPATVEAIQMVDAAIRRWIAWSKDRYAYMLDEQEQQQQSTRLDAHGFKARAKSVSLP